MGGRGVEWEVPTNIFFQIFKKKKKEEKEKNRMNSAILLWLGEAHEEALIPEKNYLDITFS